MRFGDPGFKTRSDHSLNTVPDSPWFNFSAALVNSQLVCLRPVGILNSCCCSVPSFRCVSLALKSPYGERSIKYVCMYVCMYACMYLVAPKRFVFSPLFKYKFISFIKSFTGTNETNKLTCSQLSGFVVQLVLQTVSQRSWVLIPLEPPEFSMCLIVVHGPGP